MFRVLLVEDDPDVRDIFSTALLRAGYEVIQAADGDVALARARDERPDVVLLDFGLPRRNGLDCLKWLKWDELTSDIPVVALTSRSEIEVRLAASAAGCAGYLQKPIDPREVVEAVTLLVG
jgi:DNA-binding response OmpR family regulator